MLKQLKIENFTVFPKANLEFASGLNVIVGENGCGKSHLLKLLYAVSFENTSQGRKPNAQKPNKEILERRYAEKIRNVFHTQLGQLFQLSVENINTPFQKNVRHSPIRIELNYLNNKLNSSFQYSILGEGKLEKSQEHLPLDVDILTLPSNWDNTIPVFMPTRELLTIYPSFISIYDNYYLEFDETYRDTCVLLGSLVVKGKREEQVARILKPIEEAMGGKVIFENERFYLSTTNKGTLEMPMVAEGQRKLAMLARLIATGTLLDNGYLFWDEPESNLNPKLIKVIAKVILHLCNNGIQVFIASHSLFLLRELTILSHDNKFNSINSRYFALRLEENHSVQVEQGNSIEELQTLVLLDEELSQSDRFMRSGA